MPKNADKSDGDRPESSCLMEAATAHLEKAYWVLRQGIVAGMSMETNLASIEHRRQVEAITPFLDPEERKLLKRLERRLDRQLRTVGSALMTLEGALQVLERSRHAKLLNEEDRMAVERLKIIVAKIRDDYLR